MASTISGISYKDSGNLDAFGRLRISDPEGIFDAQFTYDLQPLLFEQLVSGTGATIAHNTTERAALMTFSSTPTGGQTIMQSYEHFRYQPGKSQAIDVTFNFIEAVANVEKFAGYSDGANGIEVMWNTTNKYVRIFSNTTAGDETVPQSAWNLDRLDGSGGTNNPSGLTLDLTKTQIFVIDFQALYVGRVRVGFNINGLSYYVHEFDHSNLIAYPYIQTANLPIRVGMTCTGTVSTTMFFYCSTVISEGGQDDVAGYAFTAEGTATAGNNTRAHILSVRPKTTFNSIANRSKFVLDTVDFIVTGNTSVKWELCVGQAISGTTTYTDVNTTYSAFEFNTAGTISGSPTIVIASGYIPATNTSKAGLSYKIANRYPITLDAAGAHRSLGTLSLIVTGLGATSATRATFNWHEIR